MSQLFGELLLRLIKPLAALLLGSVVYVVATAVLGEPASVTLALLCWVSAAAFILLVETGVI